MMNAMPRGLVAWALPVLALVAGCSPQPATNSADNNGGQKQRTVRELSEAEERFLWRVEEELVSRCMAARGHRYVVAEPPASVEPERTFPYGNDDVAWARTHGFGLTEPKAARADDLGNDPNTLHVERLPPSEQQAYVTALNGDMRHSISVTLPDGRRVSTSLDGCTAEARRRLYGDPKSWLQARYLVRAIGAETHRRVLADARHRQVLEHWRACMRSRGYRYGSPGEAGDGVADLARSLPPAALREREVQVAVASAECAKRTQLVRLATRLDQEYRRRIAAEWESGVLSYHERRAEALRRARELLRPP